MLKKKTRFFFKRNGIETKKRMFDPRFNAYYF